MNLDELKHTIKATPISSIVEQYLSLKRQGNQFVALCPFHSDSNPSLMVNDTKGLFRCFACDTGGDAISFVEQFKGFSFIEAVKDIAEKLGHSLDELDKKPKNKKFELAEKILSKASQIFRKYAETKKYEAYNQFTQKRKIGEEAEEQFKLGYAPEGNVLVKYLDSISKEEREKVYRVALEIGIIRQSKHGHYYDTFQERILFPISSSFGKVVGFSSRATKDSQKAKYINSQESFIFKKKNLLYGLDHAKEAIRKKDQSIIVEGQMDCISMFQHGWKETVAISGTALSDYCIKNLINLSKKVYFALDNDQAGKKAMERIHPSFLQLGVKPLVADFSPYKDPDELLTAEGPLEMQKRLDEAIPFLDQQLNALLSQPMKTTDQKVQVLEEVFKTLAPLREDLTAKEKVIEATERLGLRSPKEEILEKYTDFLKSKSPLKLAPQKPQAPRPQKQDSWHPIEKKLVVEIISCPLLMEQPLFPKVLDLLTHDGVKRLLSLMETIFLEALDSEYLDCLKNQVLTDEGLEQESRKFLGQTLMSVRPLRLSSKEQEQVLQKFILALEGLNHQKHIKKLETDVKEALSEEEKGTILRSIADLRKQKISPQKYSGDQS